MSGSKRPPAPRGTGAGGRKLWRSVVDEYDLEEHELALLREAVRTIDDLDRLAEVVADEGVTCGQRVNPALVEQRQLRLVLARLLASLRLPAGDEDGPETPRPQRRGAARGTYNTGLGGAHEA